MVDQGVGSRQRAQLLVERAAKHYRAGTAARWGAAVVAARIVGQYERGAALGLARRLLVSVSTVENLAVAGITYKHLRVWCARNRYSKSRLIRRVRRFLTYTHFVVLGECWKRYEFEPYDALRYVVTAMRDHMTGAEMRAHIDDEQQREPGPGSALDVDSRKWKPAGEKAREIGRAVAAASARGWPGRVVERWEDNGQAVVSVALASPDGAVAVGANVLIVVVGDAKA